jgi:hypothetical protein
MVRRAWEFWEVVDLFFFIQAQMVSPRQQRVWLATGHRQKPQHIQLFSKFSVRLFYVTE